MSTGVSALAFIPSQSYLSHLLLTMTLTFGSANRRLPRHHRRLMVGALSRASKGEERPLGPQRRIPAHASRVHRRPSVCALSVLARTSTPSHHLTVRPHANLPPSNPQGWSARPTTHWIVPMLAGIPYGMGVEIIFMALTSYLSDGYGTLTASALASAAIMRSVLGALLPLLAQPMYSALGVSWASSLLGFVTLAMAVVPLLLLKFGGGLRRRSKLCRQVAEKTEEREERA